MVKTFVVEPKILLLLGIKVIAAFPLSGRQTNFEKYKE